MKNVTFLGLGAMGSRMAAALLESGYNLTVWNRTRERAEALCEKGAKWASNPREASEGADYVISMVRDDKASAEVWLDPITGAIHSLGHDAIAIECSTLSVDYIRSLHNTFNESSKRLVEAPLAGSRPQAEAKKLIFFTGGAIEQAEEIEPLLKNMGAAVHYCGPESSASTVKLMVNALFGAQVVIIMAELMAFARKVGVDVARAIDIVSSTPVCSPAAAISSKAMLEKQFAPAFPIDLVDKDFKLLEASAKTAEADLPVVNQVGKTYEKGKESGFSDDNITGIMQLFLRWRSLRHRQLLMMFTSQYGYKQFTFVYHSRNEIKLRGGSK